MAIDPTNYNLFKPNNYKLEVINPDEPDTKLINFFIQDTAVPGLTLATTNLNYQANATFWPNNRLEYEQLNCQMIINENFSNYQFIYDWMIRLRDSDNPKEEMKTIHLFTLGNTKLPIRKITLNYAWPTVLGSIPLQFSGIDTTVVLTQLSFAYQYFEMEKIT